MQILILVILILINAFFAASEIAFISLNDAKRNAICCLYDSGSMNRKKEDICTERPCEWGTFRIKQIPKEVSCMLAQTVKMNKSSSVIKSERKEETNTTQPMSKRHGYVKEIL